jgi:ferric-dicitrate binding protein FerR (iron transport regulator)
MNPHQERLKYLFEKYFNKTATEGEVDELTAVLDDTSNLDFIFELLADKWEGFKMEEPAKYSDEKIDLVWRKITATNELPEKVIQINNRRSFKWIRWAAAAVILFAVGILWITINNKQNFAPSETAKTSKPSDIAPGHDGAVLTLADGTKIVLDNAQDGKITDVAVKNGNKVSYENTNQAKVEYNTMATPKGRQFSLVLPDGTQVWLNAASSITYPTAFVGNERKVSITGEAYFEVAHYASKPFHVNVNGMDVQVLGTHFNINSYSNEQSVKTSLLQGSIRITVAGKTQVVKPGEQTEVSNNKEIRLIKNADVDAAVAWKNGFFQFSGMGIESVMRQLERWYDIEVKYEGKIPDRQFAGQIDRSATLSQVLKILQESNVHFSLDNRTLVVTP